MLRKDLSDLPAPSKPEAGRAPDDDNTYVTVIVEALRNGIAWDLPVEYNPDKPQADADTLTRHSKAATCMKEVALERDGVHREPMDDAGLHVTFIGTLMHAAWQRALEERWPDIEFEAPSTVSGLTSGSADGLRAYRPDMRKALELKSEGEFKFDKQVIGIHGKPPTGPEPSHMAQLALNVVGHDADAGTLVLLRRSSISAGQAEKRGISDVHRFGAQFTFSREELQPWADEWLEQLRWIADHPTDEVPRFMPHQMPRGAKVVDPSSGRWEVRDGDDVLDTGAVWGGAKCKYYCSVAAACLEQWREGK